jgi:hypothetical protein
MLTLLPSSILGFSTVPEESVPGAVAESDFRYDAPGGHTRKTNSYMTFLPMKDGWFQTHNTYRFMSVREQVVTVIGEAKHGLWRIHDNGMVRMYLKAGKSGLPVGVDVMDSGVLETIKSDYAA